MFYNFTRIITLALAWAPCGKIRFHWCPISFVHVGWYAVTSPHVTLRTGGQLCVCFDKMAVKGTGYFDGLQQTESKERYSAKIKGINEQDPYEISNNEWLDDLDSRPSVTYIHVGMYLLFNANPYTQEL